MSDSRSLTDATSGLHQRSCKRVACKATLSNEAGPSRRCCDNSCLIEVARRECSNECGHDPIDFEKSSQARDSVAISDIAPSAKSEHEPCTSHYKKTRDQYGAVLDNLGCICKVLLSLNIESCCATRIPSHTSIRSKRSSTSAKLDTSQEINSDPSMRIVCESVPLMEIKKAGECFEMSNLSCCSKSSEAATMTLPHLAISKLDHCSKGSCYSNKSLAEGVSEATVSAIDDCFEKRCGRGCVEADSAVSSPKSDDSCKRGCCSSNILNTNTEILAAIVADRSKTSCCSKNASNPVTQTNVSRVDDCSRIACCINELSANSLSSRNSKEAQLESAASDCIKSVALAPTPTLAAGTNDIDIEKGLFQVEHLVLSIHGMTCTGCEKKLYRSLDSLPSISNVKTSLVLAQAEFDFSGSDTGESINIIKTIERMTGFTCTKILQSGQELDMIMSGDIHALAHEKDLPPGVTDLTVLNKNTIRVTYHPEIVGARELLANPFFRLAKLAPPAARPQIASGRAHVRMTFFKTILSALLTIPVLVLAWAPLPDHKVLYGAVSLALATTVQIAIARPFYTSALKALIFSRLIETDLLIVLSTTTAYVYSVIAYAYLVVGKPLSTGEFFETSTLLVTLIMIGRAVSAFARQRAVESISIESLQTTKTLLIDPETRQEHEIDARLLQYQDTFKVLPDTSIVTDGIVIAGETEVDESMITGEARPVMKVPGSLVVAGSINYSGTLTIRLTRLPGENTIKTIGSMIDKAKLSKPKTQKTADRIAGYFVPIILVVAALVFVIWVAIGKVKRRQSAATSCIVAMTYAISALIVSCPCAIGLAVPLVVVIAGGVAAKHGLIFRSAETIETARNVSHVIFDKTGTLTQGKLSVEVEEYLMGTADSVAPILLGLTTNSKHPVSTAIAACMKASGFQPSKIENFISVAGKGMKATRNGSTILAGDPHWLGFEDSPIVHKVLSLGLTMFCLSINEELVAVFGLRDLLRPDAIETIDQLKKRSVDISIVSGDNEEAVNSVARLLGIPESHVRSRCSPTDKQIYVKEVLVREESVVMFCGDGTNDAVALAQASIGMHINEGTDIAQSTADAILMRPSLTGILTLIDLSRAFYLRVVFNFIWALIYNVFAILLAAGAFPSARIPPQYAGLGEIVSVLPVITIAMQLKWARFQERKWL